MCFIESELNSPKQNWVQASTHWTLSLQRPSRSHIMLNLWFGSSFKINGKFRLVPCVVVCNRGNYGQPILKHKNQLLQVVLGIGWCVSKKKKEREGGKRDRQRLVKTKKTNLWSHWWHGSPSLEFWLGSRARERYQSQDFDFGMTESAMSLKRNRKYSIPKSYIDVERLKKTSSTRPLGLEGDRS